MLYLIGCIFLLGSVAFPLLMQIQHASAKDNYPLEVCKWETFRANCSEGHVIFINSARYGRMRRGRCAQMEANERPCSIDILSYVDKQCGGRRSCDITLPNKDLDMMTSRPTCSKELNQYLEISYHCQEVYYASDQSCVANQSVPVVSSVGYLANIITDETNKGSSLCPWKIQLQPGQTVHMTLLDFGVYRNVTTPDKGTICHIYAVLKDSFVSNDGPGTLVCGGESRETLVLTSMAKEVQVSMKKLNSPSRDPIYFLIKYEVIGCPEFVKPESSYVEVTSSGLRVTCSDPSLGTWEVRCVHGKWEPALNNNCASSWRKSSDAPPESSLNQFHVWIGATAGGGFVLITGMIVFSAFYVAKRRTRLKAELHYRTTMENTLTNSNVFTGDRSSQHYEYILPFDTTAITPETNEQRARADSDHQYTIPQASYTSSTRTRLSHAYECLPYATMTASVATVESPSDGYLDLTAYDDYLKPVDEVVYYSINDDSAELATL